MSPKLKEVVASIEAAYAGEAPQKPRAYIGASIVGNPCTAYLSFCLRGFPETAPDPQLKRIFSLGHIIETVVNRDLKRAGVRLMENDPLTGKQWSFHLYGKHVGGHADGLIEDEDDQSIVLSEIKSMNDAKWNKFVEKGVRTSHPNYFEQCQRMMGMSGAGWTLFTAYNKNNSKYHCELIEFDPFVYSAQTVKIESVLRGEGQRIGRDRSDWRCKGCFKRGVCWEGQEVPKTCETCQHAVPEVEGGWHCTLTKRKADRACDKHQTYNPLNRS